MSTQSRKGRGYATETLVEGWFQRRGWPLARRVRTSRPGPDIEEMAGLSPEVKAKPGDVTGALKQAVKNRGAGLPFVVWRPNGYGPERIGQWPVVFTLTDATELLLAAGYGTHPEGDDSDRDD